MTKAESCGSSRVTAGDSSPVHASAETRISVERFIKRLRIFMFASWVVGVALAVGAPDDVLTRFPLLGELTGAMKRMLPIIANTAAKSSFPQVTELYLAISWLLAPLALVHEAAKFRLAKAPDIRRSIEMMNRRPTWRRWFAGMLLQVMLIGGLYIVIFLMPGDDYVLTPYNSSRTALGMIAWLLPGGFAPAGAFGGLIYVVWYQIKWIRIFLGEWK